MHQFTADYVFLHCCELGLVLVPDSYNIFGFGLIFGLIHTIMAKYKCLENMVGVTGCCICQDLSITLITCKESQAGKS